LEQSDMTMHPKKPHSNKTLFSEASTHNDAHTPPSTMSSNATLGIETRVRKQQRERRDANAGVAIPRLPNHLVVAFILRSEHFNDPADLARLPAVSRAMRDAVTATGLQFQELDENEAVKLGCLSAVKRLQRQGRLSRREYLCQAAARRTAREAAVVASGRLPVGSRHVLGSGGGRTPQGATVGTRKRLQIGRVHVPWGGRGRTARGAAMGARERLPVGHATLECR